ncbi:MAG: antibiotic biosynthesis monooxygenase [Flavobacteriaceae bacterium]|nr:antibiotic biosynthesis monooxygenase [Flavobacteriaceae bacterium]
MIAKTPKTPYYAVIFTSKRTEINQDYDKIADRMVTLAKKQKGFLGVESARNDLGITVSYWESIESIKSWKNESEHKVAQQKGKEVWYTAFKVRICKVERDYEF